MTTTTQNGHTRGNRLSGWRLALLVALAGALPAFLGVYAISRAEPSVAQQKAELTAYLDELKPLAEETGFLIIHGLRAGVNDIPAGELEQDVLEKMPPGWRADLEKLKTKFAALPVPRGYDEANDKFIEALDGYITVTHQLDDAIAAPQYRKRMLVRRASDLGEQMDRVWNSGAFVFQEALTKLGEDMVIWLPDPTIPRDY